MLALSRLALSLSHPQSELSVPISAFTSELELRDKIRYELPVLIGSPPQAFPLAIDTTVSSIVIIDAECVECGKGPKFSRNDSETYQMTSSGAYLNVTGIRGKDVVYAAGLTVPGQDIVLLQGNAGGAMNSPVGVLVGCM